MLGGQTVKIILVLFLSISAFADLSGPKKLPPPPPAGEGKMAINAVFEFGPSQYNKEIPKGAFGMKGSFDHGSREFSLKPVKWINRPENYEMVEMTGKVNAEGTSFTGKVNFDDCKEFILKRMSRNGSSLISGKWEGSYICAQGVTSLKLTIK